MRLWTLHPKYLDPQGLVALWRETLLARAVLRGETKGYRHHPQLVRFQEHPSPLQAINTYLAEIYSESTIRGYSFDGSKVAPTDSCSSIVVTSGQLAYEWNHLLRKLKARNQDWSRCWLDVELPEVHPLFILKDGPIELWERGKPTP